MAEDCRFHAVAGPALYGRSFVGRDAVRTAFAAPPLPIAALIDPLHLRAFDALIRHLEQAPLASSQA
jgi:hypothetical protein